MNFNHLSRIVEPSDLPVTLEDAKRHLRIVGIAEDQYIIECIEAATASIDGPHGIGIALCPATYAYSLTQLSREFTIPIYPVRTVTKIEWIDREGFEQVSTDFRVNKISNPARVFHNVSGNALQDSVVVTFTAGYDVIPADLRQAILMLVGHFYENREATSVEKLETVPLAVETILARYRVG